MGWFRPVHAKSAGSQEVRALLAARKQIQHKLKDIELSLRGILRGFGLKVGKVTEKTFEARIRELVTGHPMLEQIAEAMLAARAALLPLGHLQSPALECREACDPQEQHIRRLVKGCANHRIANPADTAGDVSVSPDWYLFGVNPKRGPAFLDFLIRPGSSSADL
jgi:transposase